MSIFDKYNSKMNAEALKASQEEIKSNATGDFEEIPVGKYEVEINKMECKKSKSGNLMVSIWFKILEGNYANSIIFYNGVFHKDYPRHNTAKFLNQLLNDGDHVAEINLILKSGDMDTINNFCMDIHESVDGRFEYLLDYGKSKDFNTYNIVEVFAVD